MSGTSVRALVVVCALLGLATACNESEAAPEQSPSGTPSSSPGTTGTPGPGQPTGSTEQPSAAVVTVKPGKGAEGIRPDQPVTVTTSSGKLRSLTVRDDEGGSLKGSFNENQSQWTSLPQLRPGASYQVKGVATGTDGKDVKIDSTFSTLHADRRLKASVVPLAGETVGVAMPIQVIWNHPVKDKDKAAVERRLTVETSVPVEGSWRWTGDEQVNWRPKDLWPANTKVTVDVAIQGVSAGEGLWGAASRRVGFQIGHSVVAHVNVKKHVMVVRIDGKVARNVPVTAGKSGFTTRSGFKVIMEKHRIKRMDGRTVGINPGDPEYYDIRDVPYAHRVTSSGEFVHGAYWSEGSQGRENVSHGCVGMSVKDAAWYFAQTNRGDPVIVTGTKRGMEPGNGWTDWNMTWEQYKAGSALS